MSELPNPDQGDYELLAWAAITGVATRQQLIQGSGLSPSEINRRLQGLEASGLIEELERRFRAHHYAGQIGRTSAVFRLTRSGADLLQQMGYTDAVSRVASNPATIQHSLAVVDVRRLLLAMPDVEAVQTERPLSYAGRNTVRPDNLVIWSDNDRLPVLVETETRPTRSHSLPRLIRKIQNLDRLFRVFEGQSYDSLIRIIYLWKKPDETALLNDHDRAIEIWADACKAVRDRSGDRRLHFEPIFLSHADFMGRPTLEPRDYEPLPPGAAAPNPAGGNAAPASAPAQLHEEIDAEGLKFVADFYKHVKLGAPTMDEVLALEGELRAFLGSRPLLQMQLSGVLRGLTRAGSEWAYRLAVEGVGITVLEGLNIPAHPINAQRGKKESVPILAQAVSDGGSRPGLTFHLNSQVATPLLAAWPGDHETLVTALEILREYLIAHRVRLDLTRPVGRRGS